MLPDYREFIAPLEPYDSAKWRTRLLECCRWFRNKFWRHWYALYLKDGYVKANLWLVGMHKRLKLGGTGLFINASAGQIMTYAKVKAKLIALDSRDFGKRFDKQIAISNIKTLFERTGIPFPLDDRFWKGSYNSKKVVAALARIENPRWLARQLRVKASREFEQICRELGLVKKGKFSYLSEYTLRRMLNQQNANRKLLERLIATNDLGQQYTLAELSDLGVSNPVIRRNELMTRLSGFEEWADDDTQQWKAMFYTITTPSKYHAMTSHGNKVIQNPKYEGATPKEAQDYINTLWQRVRAEAKRQEIEFFGFRVAEPHHDGTPHWHLLLFILDEHEQALTSILQNYAFAEDGNEPGADKHRFAAVVIDPEKGRATGYIAKYISKNIDGYQVDIDEESGECASISAISVACWASVWGIRQFQQIGGPPVTVWRELRRDTIEITDDQELLAIQKAADCGDWKEFVEKMGGATVKRIDLPIRALYFITPNAGQYGEDLSRLIGIFSHYSGEIKTRLRTWIVGLAPLDDSIRMNNQILRTGPPCGPLEYCQ